MVVLLAKFELNLCYEVDLLVLILTNYVADNLRSMFEIADNISIILNDGNLVPNIHL